MSPKLIKTNIIFCLLLISWSNSIFGQSLETFRNSFYEKVNKIELDSAYNLFKKYLEKKTVHCKDFVYAASICSKIDKKSESYRYLDLALSCGIDTVEIFTLSTFKNLKNDSIWNNKFGNFEKLFNPNLRNTLLELKEKDQQMLQFYSIPKSDSNWKVSKYKFDSTQISHEKFVTSLIDTYGIVPINSVGKDAQMVILLVLQHSWDTKLRLKYYPFFKKATFENKFDKQMFALFHDRVKVEMGKKQLYGSQYYRSDLDGKVYLFPVKRYNGLAKRRSQMNLEKIDNFLLRNNIEDYFSNKKLSMEYLKQNPKRIQKILSSYK
jgi:hypothetical protein